MKYRFLGNSGLEVSEICFGVMTFVGEQGWTHVGSSGQKEAAELTALAIDHGVNFFDTADIYSSGISEELLGKALGPRRKDVIIGTKCGFRMKDGPNGDGLSRMRIIEACDASLKRLKTDYIDLYQLHSYDFSVPLEESMLALQHLVQQGKVRYIGVSNFAAWHLVKAQDFIRQMNGLPIISNQVYYTLMGRDIELEIIPACEDQGIGIMVWGPLHGGFLSGKYRRNAPWPADTRLKKAEDMRPSQLEQGYNIVDVLDKIASRRKVPVVQVALNYLLRKTAVSSVVIGATSATQLMENIGTSDWKLDREEIAELDKVSTQDKFYPYWYYDLYRKDRMKPED